MSDIEVQSIQQLLAIALAAERAASKRYMVISERMMHSGNRELADLFANIARSEREHAQEVERMLQALGIEELPEAPKIAWQHPQVRDDRDRATSPATSTPYLALAYAVNNEDLAFRFYSYVAANAKDQEVRRFAEVFAKEELAHAELFREQRRRAYHEQRSRVEDHAIPALHEIQSMADLLAAAVDIERKIRDLLLTAASMGMEVSDSVDASNALLDQLELDLGGKARQSSDSRSGVVEAAGTTMSSAAVDDIERAIFDATEQAFMFYDGVMEVTQDEDIMLRAQSLTESALTRLNALASTDNDQAW